MKKVLIGIACFGILGVIAIGITSLEQKVDAAASQVKFSLPHCATSADATSGLTVWNTHTEERWQIENLIVSSASAMAVEIYDGDTYLHTYYFNPNGGACPIYNIRSASAGNDLVIKTEQTGTISVLVSGPPLWF